MLDATQIILSGYLAFTSFCRLRKTDQNTIPAVRHAFALLATISVILCLQGCLLPVHPSTVLALIGIAVVQTVCAKFWARHVPDQFVIQPENPMRRESDTPTHSN